MMNAQKVQSLYKQILNAACIYSPWEQIELTAVFGGGKIENLGKDPDNEIIYFQWQGDFLKCVKITEEGLNNAVLLGSDGIIELQDSEGDAFPIQICYMQRTVINPEWNFEADSNNIIEVDGKKYKRI